MTQFDSDVLRGNCGEGDGDRDEVDMIVGPS